MGTEDGVSHLLYERSIRLPHYPSDKFGQSKGLHRGATPVPFDQGPVSELVIATQEYIIVIQACQVPILEGLTSASDCDMLGGMARTTAVSPTTVRIDRDFVRRLQREKGITNEALVKAAGYAGNWPKAAQRIKREEYPFLAMLSDKLRVHPFDLLKEVNVDGYTQLHFNKERFHELLRANQMSQRKLARDIGVHYNSIQLWQRYEFKWLNRFAKALGVQPWAMLRVENSGLSD